MKNEEEQSIHWNSMCKGFEAILGNERQQTGPASWRRTRKWGWRAGWVYGRKVWFSQFSSVAQSCPTLCDSWTAAHQASLSITNFRSLLMLMSIELVMPSNHLILCHPLFLLPSIFLSIRVFSSESALCIRWPKYWSFSFSISPSNEYSGLVFFRIDWFDLLADQETLKSLLQHHSSKTSILWHLAFFMVQLSYPYMTTGETIALTIRTFVSKVMFLLFNTLSSWTAVLSYNLHSVF